MNTDKMEKRHLPPMPYFENEAAEADWWFDHREELAQDLITAMEQGTSGIGSLGRYAQKQKELEDASLRRSTETSPQKVG